MPDEDERLRQAIRVGSIGIFDHDHNSDVIFWSLELRQFYGWEPDEPRAVCRPSGPATPPSRSTLTGRGSSRGRDRICSRATTGSKR